MIFFVTQIVGASLSWLLLKVFTRFEIIGQEFLKELNRPLIIVANHESYLDPQLIGVALLTQPRLLPIRYMAKNELFAIPGLNLLIWLLGAFKANRGHGLDKALATPYRLLQNGSAVVMFPEGRPVRERGTLGPGKRGAAALGIQTQTLLLPMSLHIPANLTPWRFLFTRPKIVVRVGQSFYLDKARYPNIADDTTARATAVVMDKIAELYRQHTY